MDRLNDAAPWVLGVLLALLVVLLWVQEIRRRRATDERLGPDWRARREDPTGDERARARERWEAMGGPEARKRWEAEQARRGESGR